MRGTRSSTLRPISSAASLTSAFGCASISTGWARMGKQCRPRASNRPKRPIPPCYDSAHMLRVCLDTNITSDRVLKDLDPAEERLAAEQIEVLHQQGLIKRVTTPVSRAEERRTTNLDK